MHALATVLLCCCLISPAGASDGAAEKRKAAACAPCHGATGASISEDVPSIAGQQKQYLFLQLIQFREGRRNSVVMAPIVEKMSDQDFQVLAAFFSAQKPATARLATDPRKVAAGRIVSQREFCESCHMPGFTGQKQVPRLVGQHVEYIVKQLREFKAQTRADIDGSMTTAAQPLNAEDIENVAQYIASLTPAPTTRPRAK
jgi:cytochrome c553